MGRCFWNPFPPFRFGSEEGAASPCAACPWHDRGRSPTQLRAQTAVSRLPAGLHNCCTVAAISGECSFPTHMCPSSAWQPHKPAAKWQPIPTHFAVPHAALVHSSSPGAAANQLIAWFQHTRQRTISLSSSNTATTLCLPNATFSAHELLSFQAHYLVATVRRRPHRCKCR